MSLIYKQNFLIYISILFILFGIISYARLQLKAHVFYEVIMGLLIGVSVQYIVFAI
jgi:membrane-associated phospholipid phosphatase